MDIISQLAEYKSKIEALSTLAAQAETFETELTSLKADKETFASALEAKETALKEESDKAIALAAEVETLKASIADMEANKKASDERALEICANLGLKEIPVITITSTDKPTAQNIREKYMAISDPTEKGVFFNENRKAILNGIVE